ncbi:MAG: hypothetical protein JZU52_02755 [Lamprocystis purpurea]|jgi:hypothetical protein|uniref:hypothetical protein n=1 Tax=Lamprocystis purpurea TaxID=61598 RepID=UPI00035E5D8C|nr:hypothetical protein [Lamprocystis purpurea]MBV5272592.1 hypothetical protein [Lamprocystis purpurea]
MFRFTHIHLEQYRCLGAFDLTLESDLTVLFACTEQIGPATGWRRLSAKKAPVADRKSARIRFLLFSQVVAIGHWICDTTRLGGYRPVGRRA